MEQKVIKVFAEGKPECDHEFIYDKPIKISFTFPPIVQQCRICEQCGKVELVSESEVFEFEIDKFLELVEKVKAK